MEDKDVGNKYDRQVRLWSPNGQKRLAESHICVINATTTACETLKNLVLPGVGQITVVDSEIVCSQDLATNFFVLHSDFGHARGECVAQNLGDLNPDVELRYESQPIEILVTQEKFWMRFDCVIDCSLGIGYFGALVELLWGLNVPLVHVTSLGFYGVVRIYHPEQTMIETHDNNIEDLRLDLPWKELQFYIDAIDLEKLDDKTFSDIPYSIILTKIYQEYRLKQEKRPTPREVRLLLKSIRRADEVNLEEADKRAAQIMKDSTELPHRLAELFEDSKTDCIDEKTPIFWVYVAALKEFYQKHGTLPLSGSLPDMTSDTARYTALQRLYREKHEADKKELSDVVVRLLEAVGRSKEEINVAEFESFVKNCKFIEVHRGSKKTFDAGLLEESGEWASNSLNGVCIYLAFLALGAFYSDRARYPGPDDRAELRAKAIAILCQYRDLKTFPDGLELILDEILRCEGDCLTNIASVIGGIASQEVIKILTNQYITLDNCLAFDGVKSQGFCWKM